MIPPVYLLLHASAEVVALVADRIGEHGRVFPQETRPYITWQIVSGGTDAQLDRGRACHDRSTVQVDCWHADSSGLAALAEAVRTALESDCYFVGPAADEQDDETRLYRFGLLFDFIL